MGQVDGATLIGSRAKDGEPQALPGFPHPAAPNRLCAYFNNDPSVPHQKRRIPGHAAPMLDIQTKMRLDTQRELPLSGENKQLLAALCPCLILHAKSILSFLCGQPPPLSPAQG